MAMQIAAPQQVSNSKSYTCFKPNPHNEFAFYHHRSINASVRSISQALFKTRCAILCLNGGHL